MKVNKILMILTAIVAFGLLGYVYIWYNKAFSDNLENWNEEYFYVKSESSFQNIKNNLAPYLKNVENFESIAEQRNYTTNVIAGRFKLRNGMTNYDIIQALRANVPVRVTFNNMERIENLAARIAEQLEQDSLSMMEIFLDEEFLKDNELTKETALTCYLPETYEFYWNVSPLRIRNTLHKEYIRFWNEERRKKAESLNLTPAEVTILASIVQKETAKSDERARVAGVYLNRLKIGMPLQADPTVVYTKKMYTDDFDQVINRVYRKDTEILSPYNTYINIGLPPGPIFMPDKTTIDAVLDAENHDYIYFCASVDRVGYHEFARSLEQHNQNSLKYRRWLDQNGIK